MKTYINPLRKEWPEIVKRPVFDVSELYEKVQSVLNDIRSDGDSALIEYTKKFDGVELDSFEVSEEEFEAANQVDDH